MTASTLLRALPITAALASCSLFSGPDRIPTELRLDPAELILYQGTSAPVTATVLDQFGEAIPRLQVQWSTQSGAIATVDAAGVVTGHLPGRTELTAIYESRGTMVLQQDVTVNVRLPPVAILSVQQLPGLVRCGRVLPEPYRVRAVDATGAGVSRVRVEFVSRLFSPSKVLSVQEAITDDEGYAEIQVIAPPPSGNHPLYGASGAELVVFAALNDTLGTVSSTHCLDLASLSLSPDTLRAPADGLPRLGGLNAAPLDHLGQRFRTVNVDFVALDTTVIHLMGTMTPSSFRGQQRSYIPLKSGVTRVIASFLGLSDTTYVEFTPLP